jgi:hypothetical protein
MAALLAAFVVTALLLLATPAGTVLLVLLAGLARMPAMLSTMLATLLGVVLILVRHPISSMAAGAPRTAKRAASYIVPGRGQGLGSAVATCGPEAFGA